MWKALSLFTVFAAGVAVRTAVGATYTIADLEQIASRNAGILSSVDLSFHETQEVISIDPGSYDDAIIPGGDLIAESIERIVCDTSSDRYYCERQWRTRDMDELAPPTWFAYSGGDVTQMFMPRGKGAMLVRTTEPLVKTEENTILAEGWLFPPGPKGTGLEVASIFNMLRNASLVGEESVYGDECVVLDLMVAGVRVMTYWLDPKHGLLPRKWVTFGRDEKIVTEGAAPEVAEFHTPSGESVWLPARIEQVNTVGGMTVRRVTVLDTNRTVVNPVLDASDFEIDFPPGTKVQDATGEQPRFYTVSAAGDMVADEYLEGLYADYRKAKSRRGGTQGDPGGDFSGACGVGVLPPTLLLTTGFLCLLLVRQRRLRA